MTGIRIEPGGVRASAYDADVWAELQGEMMRRMSPGEIFEAWKIEGGRK